jgi:hypothetical protein
MAILFPLIFYLIVVIAHSEAYLFPSRTYVDSFLKPFFHGVELSDPLSDCMILRPSTLLMITQSA